MNLTIIDYGAGNVANVRNAFEKIRASVSISKEPKEWKTSDAIVLPGVGAFGPAIEKLGEGKEKILELLEEGIPFLGICLGMQILFERSEESPKVNGLGIFKGEVKRFRTKLPVPQIGWNIVRPINSPLFEGIKEFYAYFVNSYYCDIEKREIISATSEYGIEFPSAIWCKNIFATQFHPEKSGIAGLQVLENFIKEVKA